MSSRRLAAVLALIVLVAAAGSAWLLTRGEDDGLGDLRAAAAVASVRATDGELVVALRRGATIGEVERALDLLPDAPRVKTVHLGRAVLDVRGRRTPGGSDARTLVALAGVRAPATRLALGAGLGAQPIQAQVARRSQAFALAREIVTRVAPRGLWPGEVDGLRVVHGAPETTVVALGRGGDANGWLAALAATGRLAAYAPQMSTVGERVELRLRIGGRGDAAGAWRAAGRAFAGRAQDAVVYLDAPGGPILSGPPGSDPRRALDLLAAFGGGYAATDLAYVRVRVPRRARARGAAEAARAAGARRLELAWPAIDGAPRWFDATGIDRDATTLIDTPAKVLALLPGVTRIAAAGIEPLAWRARGTGDPASLQLTRPSWLDADRPDLRRLATAIRKLRWPGRATFRVLLGPGSCTDQPDAQAVAQVDATSDGRARSVRSGAACTDDEAVAALRQAWNATAR